jgi:DNA-binding transcriptional LysR family regulator
MDFRQFRYFVVTAELLHFGRAADRLGIAQPVLSQQIKTMEAQIGAQLFNRERRRVELTETGKVLLEGARDALAFADRAVKRAQGVARGESGSVAIGIVGSVMYEADVSRLLSDYCQNRPNVNVLLNELPVLSQLEAIRNRNLDIAIVRRPIPAHLLEGLDYFTVSSQRLVAALPATHRLAGFASVKLQDLSKDPFLGFPDPEGIGMHQSVLDVCQHAGFVPKFALRIGNLTTIVSLVAKGFGIALVVDIVDHLRIPGVCYLPIEDPGMDSDLILVHRRFERSASVCALIDDIRDFVRARERAS